MGAGLKFRHTRELVSADVTERPENVALLPALMKPSRSRQKREPEEIIRDERMNTILEMMPTDGLDTLW